MKPSILDILNKPVKFNGTNPSRAEITKVKRFHNRIDVSIKFYTDTEDDVSPCPFEVFLGLEPIELGSRCALKGMVDYNSATDKEDTNCCTCEDGSNCPIDDLIRRG